MVKFALRILSRMFQFVVLKLQLSVKDPAEMLPGFCKDASLLAPRML
jgi:hypothetical protein